MFAFAAWRASLRNRADWIGTSAQRRLMAAKYLLRALSLPLRHQRFLRFLQGQPLLRAWVARDPRLQERHLHRFVNRYWRRRERLAAVQSHYRVLLQHWPAALFEAVYLRGRATLGELTLKDGQVLQLHLCPPIQSGCEGELTLELSDLEQRPLYRLVLTLIDARTLAIGCLQGPSGTQGREQVRVLTRQMHGLRPKQLMMSLVYAFAARHGIARVLAIGGAAHPLSRRDRFLADYDGYWRELGGMLGADGWFTLPPALPHRDVAEVESRHRAAFRRREQLCAAAQAMLTDALHPTPWSMDPASTLESPPTHAENPGEALWSDPSRLPAIPA